MKALPYVLLLAALAWFIPQSCANDARWKDWSADTTRLLRSVDGLQSQKRILERENDSLRGVAERNATTASRLSGSARSWKGVADSLGRLMDDSTMAPEPSELALGRIEALGVAYDSLSAAYGLLEGAFRDQQRAYGNLERLSGTQSVAIDSLVALIRRTPGRCKVLGLINCPVVIGGYGLTVKGPQAFVGVGIPLR